MKKLKNNKVLDLRNKSEKEKIKEMGKLSKKINEILKKGRG